MSQEPDATPTLRPRHGNDAGSKSTKVQRNVFDLQKGFRFKISAAGALDALQRGDQRRFYVEHFQLMKEKSKQDVT